MAVYNATIQHANHWGYIHRAAASRTTKIVLNFTSNREKQTVQKSFC